MKKKLIIISRFSNLIASFKCVSFSNLRTLLFVSELDILFSSVNKANLCFMQNTYDIVACEKEPM